MSKKLLIVFVKNIKLGKVKTRLAKAIGDNGAYNIYKELVKITEKATEDVVVDKLIYFSDTLIDTKWKHVEKRIQQGVDLGARMENAFKEGFENGYDKIVLIGSDLPDISSTIIEQSFTALEKKEVVFGPAEDGGYYLIGLSRLHSCIFKNKAWSTSNLLETTVNELNTYKIAVSLLQTLNDIDTFDDYKKSSIYKIVAHD